MELTPPSQYRMSLTAAEVEELLLSVYTKTPLDKIRTSLENPSDETIPTTKAVTDALGLITGDLEYLGDLSLLDVLDLGSSKAVGILPISNGGTGGGTVELAQQNLGIVVETAIQAMINASISEIQSVDLSSDQTTGILSLSKGGTGANGVSQARNNLGVWSADQSEILKVDMFEALRRSYAEAGYTLVSGSFELGGVLESTAHVLLYEATGVAYSWAGTFPQVVAPDTDPDLDAGYEMRSDTALRKVLATPGGSASIGFQQGAVGAVERTSESKMREFVSVKDFGAVGDGVTDDTAAVQAASNAAGVGSVSFPRGPYNFNFNKPPYGQTWEIDSVVNRSQLGGTGTNVKFNTSRLTYLDGPHATSQLHAKHYRAIAKGSQQIGAQYADYGLSVHIEKENWSESAGVPLSGEINVLNLSMRNGCVNGDPVKTGGAAILADIGQTAGSGYVQVMEAVNSVFSKSDFSLTKQTNIQILGIDEKNGESLGVVLNAFVGAQTDAIRIQGSASGTWGNILTNVKNGVNTFRITDDGNIRFRRTQTMILGQDAVTNDLVVTNEVGEEIARFNSATHAFQTFTRTDAVSGAAYTLLPTDRNKIKSLFHSAAITCTLPNDTPVGCEFRVLQRDAASQITFAPSVGATLRNIDGHTKTKGQHAICNLVVTSNSTGTNAVWYLTGQTAL